MIPFDELVTKRRSIRRYTAERPPEEMILAMVRAALEAPSPSNSQPVRFIRVTSERLRGVLREGVAARREALLAIAERAGRPKWMRNRVRFYARYMDFMFDAPVLMAVATLRPPERPAGPEELFGPRTNRVRRANLGVSAGLALMSYLLKGEELGLGSCILSAPLLFLDDPEKLLGLEGMDLICFITTGYPAEEPPPPGKKELGELYLHRS
ncbi:MAG: nitroreductase family protein [Syntrophales bacterium]